MTEILKQRSAPLKTCRLVSHFWNEIALSLTHPRIGLKPNPIFENESTSIHDSCHTFDARLAKMICVVFTRVGPLDSFASEVTNLCAKFTNLIHILDLTVDQEFYMKTILHILQNFCPNLKQFRLTCTFFACSTRRNPAPEEEQVPLSLKPNLTSFTLSVRNVAPLFPSFAQLVVNAAPNLGKVTLPMGVCPDLGHSTQLDSLTIALDATKPSGPIAQEDCRKLSELSRMLDQVRDQLVHLNICCVNDSGIKWVNERYDYGSLPQKVGFQLPRRMWKLERLRNETLHTFQCSDLFQNVENVPVLSTLVIGKTFKDSRWVHEILRNVCESNNVLGSMRDLTIIEAHDASLLAGLVTAFPNLERLKVDTFYRMDFRGDMSGMELGVVLKVCAGWKRLKHLNLALSTYPEQIGDVIKALVDARELYMGEFFNPWKT